MKPAQAALRSTAPPLTPISAATIEDVAGICLSGVVVQSTSRPTSLGSRSAVSRALRAARTASSPVVPIEPGAGVP